MNFEKSAYAGIFANFDIFFSILLPSGELPIFLFSFTK